MRRELVKAKTFRIIPSRYPPIPVFENLLDPGELEQAYADESATNDRLRDQAGDISLVNAADRVVGPGTSPIMAAFTHIGTAGRFSDGSFGVYYAGLSEETAIAESSHSHARYLLATKEYPQDFTMRCYTCVADAELADVRADAQLCDPNSWAAGQQFAAKARAEGEVGILYASARHSGGECIAALKPTVLVPPANQCAHYSYHFDGKRISSVMAISQIA